MHQKRICIMVSGSGSNCQTIIDAVSSKQLNAEIVRIIADRDCESRNRAMKNDIPFTIIDRKLDKSQFTEDLLAIIPENIDLIILAGYLSILPQTIIRRFPNKIINIHPSLLPKYGGIGMHGLNIHRAVLAAQEKQSGCTTHYVNEGVDTGDIIAQTTVSISEDETAQSLQQKILNQEHQLLLATVRKILQ